MNIVMISYRCYHPHDPVHPHCHHPSGLPSTQPFWEDVATKPIQECIQEIAVKTKNNPQEPKLANRSWIGCSIYLCDYCFSIQTYSDQPVMNMIQLYIEKWCTNLSNVMAFLILPPLKPAISPCFNQLLWWFLDVTMDPCPSETVLGWRLRYQLYHPTCRRAARLCWKVADRMLQGPRVHSVNRINKLRIISWTA